MPKLSDNTYLAVSRIADRLEQVEVIWQNLTDAEKGEVYAAAGAGPRAANRVATWITQIHYVARKLEELLARQ